MRQGSQCESVFVDVLRLVKKRFDEIAAADIMGQVAKVTVAKRVIAHILNDAAPVSVSMGLDYICLRGVRIGAQQQLLD